MSTITPTFQGEVQFRRYSDTSTQGQQLVFAVHGRDELERFIGKEGKRFMAVLVEIGDDEQPVMGNPISPVKPRAQVGENCYWAIRRCEERIFWDFLNRAFPSADTVTNGKEAGDLLRFVCTVDSRKEFDENEGARNRFMRLIKAPFQKYLIARRS